MAHLAPGRTALTLVLALALALAACAQPEPVAPPEGAARPTHHTADGFRNSDGSPMDKPLSEVLRWRLSRQTPPLPDPPLPAATPQWDLAPPQLTWLGHSTALIRLRQLTLITDPQFSERASPFPFLGPQRAYPLPVTPAQLPHVDVVLISHNHYDHLDLASVQALQAQAGGPPLFVVPLGLKAWLAEQGLAHVVELDWWQSHTVKGVALVLTPAHHWSSRSPWDRYRTLWGGFAVLAPEQRLIYTGDTGYSADFAAIRQRLAAHAPFDTALIPIGCYEPRAFMQGQHVNPADAVRVFQDLGARRAVGVHWGTFQDLCDEPLDQAPRDLARARQQAGLADDAFVALRRGETLGLARP